MQLNRLTQVGNKFFEKKLKGYNNLGISYADFWQKAFDDFISKQIGGTDQGIKHCRNVEHNIWKLIGNYGKYLPLETLYVLSLSCALHDCAKTGKISNHAIVGAKIIQDKLVSMGYVQRQSTANAMAWIVSAHESGIFSPLLERVSVGGDVEIRLKDCAAIFRLADMMDTCEDRAARFHKIFNLPHATLNPFLNDVRLCIHDCSLSKTDIEVKAYTTDINSQRNVKIYIKGLNKDLTSEHIQLLKNIKVVYLTKNFVERSKNISLPYKFVLSWQTHFPDTLPPTVHKVPTVAKKIPVTGKGISRLVPCYFINTETNVDIDRELFDSIKIKKEIDPKFLYWSLTGAKAYLSLIKNPLYTLPNIAHDLLIKSLATQIYPIIENANRKVHQLVDLGPGNGVELNIMLNILISNMTENLKIQCSMVDFSYHMLRIAVNTLDDANLHNEKYKDNIVLYTINGDFRNLYLYKSILSGSGGSRVFTFLGGTLGNYFEREVIEPIRREMSKQDFFLLGVDLLGDRSDEELRGAYDSIYNRKFLFNPLAEIGCEFEHCEFKSEIKARISEVPKSKTVISWFTVDNEDIQVSISTKYDLTSLKSYLKDRFGFHILKDVINDTGEYAILLMAK